ncbi:HisA/HisF-related TIM barrel protein [Methanospirillum lacunae]|uniref:Nickel transporter n=1 Tax=Methanospirillum lacunae TaxID=668570 RepID=A0A2V2N6B2_9EURY|nr:HisA/HisF-related TIM barrel protein [Methanospirillum lacunae]PWR72028.1 nickel transporter [Methanospirillum lacunae]
MDLILAADLKSGKIVHGKSGRRDEYRPVQTPLASTAEPIRYLQEIRPRYLYIADLDRITDAGNHDLLIPDLAGLVDSLYLDRGCRSPDDMLDCPGVKNIVGTETVGSDLSAFRGGFLSVDMKEGLVVPGGEDPAQILDAAKSWSFDGCILLDIGGVGTRRGLDRPTLERFRVAYQGRLFWGGGVSGMEDLTLLASCGFDGAIIATALHSGAIPLIMIREGCLC